MDDAHYVLDNRICVDELLILIDLGKPFYMDDM